VIQESKQETKAIEEDKEKHTASTNPGIDYSTTFRNVEEEGDLIPSGQVERPETFTRIIDVLLQNRQQQCWPQIPVFEYYSRIFVTNILIGQKS
jgi:hypothetical protein